MSEILPAPSIGGTSVDFLRRLLEKLRDPGRTLNVALSVIVILVALTPFLSPSTRDLFGGDETRYSEIVREMSQHHSLLVRRARPLEADPLVLGAGTRLVDTSRGRRSLGCGQQRRDDRGQAGEQEDEQT